MKVETVTEKTRLITYMGKEIIWIGDRHESQILHSLHERLEIFKVSQRHLRVYARNKIKLLIRTESLDQDEDFCGIILTGNSCDWLERQRVLYDPSQNERSLSLHPCINLLETHLFSVAISDPALHT
jgi:hypothetical protein